MGSVQKREAREKRKRWEMLEFIDRQIDHLQDGETISIKNIGGKFIIGRDFKNTPPPPENTPVVEPLKYDGDWSPF